VTFACRVATLGDPAVRPTLGVAGFNTLVLGTAGVEGLAGLLILGVVTGAFVTGPLPTLGVVDLVECLTFGAAEPVECLTLGVAEPAECLTLGAVFILRSLFLPPTRWPLLRFGPAGDLKVDLSNPLARLPARVGLVVRLAPAAAPSLMPLVELFLLLLNVLFVFLVIFPLVRLA